MNFYERVKAWWRMRQYIKELKSNGEPFRWGTHEKTFDKNRPASIDTLIAGVARPSKPDVILK
jgi:hypothetical protein